MEKRRGKNFKFYALLYFQDNDSIIKNSTSIPFSKVRNHAYEDFDVIESGIWEKKNLFAHLMYINYASREGEIEQADPRRRLAIARSKEGKTGSRWRVTEFPLFHRIY